MWSRVACRTFLGRKSWFLVTLAVFLTSQSVIKSVAAGNMSEGLHYATFVFRLFIYVFSMGQMIFPHLCRIIKGYRKGDTVQVLGCLRLPTCLTNWQDVANLVFMTCLIAMLTTELILHNLGEDGNVSLNDTCQAAEAIRVFPYSMFTMTAICAASWMVCGRPRQCWRCLAQLVTSICFQGPY